MITLNIKLALWFSLSTVLFCACTTNKIYIKQTQSEKLNTLQSGKTTNEEVRIILGNPDVTLTKGQTKIWFYLDQKNSKKQVYQLPNSLQGQGIVLTFDTLNLLRDIKYVNREDVESMQTQKNQNK